MTHVLQAAGADWGRVVKVKVMLKRHEDWDEMNRIYAGYVPNGTYPARISAIAAEAGFSGRNRLQGCSAVSRLP